MCASCEPGKYDHDGDAGTRCVPCGGGRFGDAALTAQITQDGACPHRCPTGKFGNRTGRVSEDAACPGRCPAGTFGREAGQVTEAAACDPVGCPAGKYTPAEGSASADSCLPCPKGRAGHRAGRGSEAAACTSLCPDGHKTVDGSGPCELCAYRERCRRGTCALGANGTLCEFCVEGYFPMGSRCEACPEDGVPLGGLIMLGICGLAGMALYYGRIDLSRPS